MLAVINQVLSLSAEPPLPVPPAWTPLPLGLLAPRGWALEQLLLQANSLSGYMPLSTFPGADTVNQSVWVGGTAAPKGGTDQWLPYWANGNVPLLMLLRAAGPAAVARLDPAAQLGPVVDRMMQYVLGHVNRSKSGPGAGWIGPFLNEPGDTNGHGLWDPLNMCRALLMYSEGEPSSRPAVAAAVVAHLTAEARLLESDPVYKWAATRWPTFVQVAAGLRMVAICTEISSRWDAFSAAALNAGPWPDTLPSRAPPPPLWQVCLYVVDHVVPQFAGEKGLLPVGAFSSLLGTFSEPSRREGGAASRRRRHDQAADGRLAPLPRQGHGLEGLLQRLQRRPLPHRPRRRLEHAHPTTLLGTFPPAS